MIDITTWATNIEFSFCFCQYYMYSFRCKFDIQLDNIKQTVITSKQKLAGLQQF